MVEAHLNPITAEEWATNMQSLLSILGGPPGDCRSCGATVTWVTTRHDKKMPVNFTGVSHFATCPNAKTHRAR